MKTLQLSRGRENPFLSSTKSSIGHRVTSLTPYTENSRPRGNFWKIWNIANGAAQRCRCSEGQYSAGHSLSVEFIRSTGEFFHPALLRGKLTTMAVCRGLPSLYRERNRLIRLSENVRIFGIISVISLKSRQFIFLSCF